MITLIVFSAFGANPSLEVRGVFLDLSKASDRVWHEDLLHKLMNSGINGNILDLIESYVHNRHQRVVLNGQSFNWKFVKAGVVQGSVLKPLFFLIYNNDLPQGLMSDVKSFADDTSLFSIVNCSKAFASVLNSDLLKIQDWSNQLKTSFNPDRTKQAQEVLFSRKINKIVHPLNNLIVKLAHTQK